MTEPRYQNGKIYKLVSNVSDKIYIGSTCLSLAKRLYAHKKSFKQFQKTGNKRRATASTELFELGGEVEIILIEDYPCQTKNELERRERFHIETNVCVNKIIPTRTKSEWYDAIKKNYNSLRKQRYEKNKDIICARQNAYYHRNKEEINAKNKARRVVCSLCQKILNANHFKRHERTQHAEPVLIFID